MFYINKDAFKKAGPRSEQGAQDLEGSHRSGREAESAGQQCVTPPAGRPGCTSRTSAPGTTCRSAPSRTAWRLRHRLHHQFAAARAPHRDARRHGEEGPVHLRRPHQPGRRQVLQRRVRDVQRQRRRPGGHQEGGEVRMVDQLHPYHDDVKGAPQNSIIGGASVW